MSFSASTTSTFIFFQGPLLKKRPLTWTFDCYPCLFKVLNIICLQIFFYILYMYWLLLSLSYTFLTFVMHCSYISIQRANEIKWDWNVSTHWGLYEQALWSLICRTMSSGYTGWLASTRHIAVSMVIRTPVRPIPALDINKRQPFLLQNLSWIQLHYRFWKTKSSIK